MQTIEEKKQHISVYSAKLFNIQSKKEFLLSPGSNFIGRHPSKCISNFSQNINISKIHAVIVFEEVRGLTIQDLGSANGTYLNNIRIRPMRPYPIRNGDHIRFADTESICYIETMIREQERDIVR